MKALVTGAAGFIGSTLVRAVRERGDTTVRGIDCFSDYYAPALKRQNVAWAFGQDADFVDADLNAVDMDELLEDVDVVFHLAGQPGVRRSWGTEFETYVTANISATQKVLEAAVRSSRRPRVVYASSSSVYGDAEAYPTDEQTLPRPRSPYGVTKLAAEHLCRLYGANESLSTVSLRFFTVYGPRQRPDMAFTRFLSAGDTDQPIHLFGSGDQIRDFTYVNDIVGALLSAAAADVAPGSIFNVSGGGSHSVNEVLEVMQSILGRELRVIRENSALGDVSRTSADITSITQHLDWVPRVPLREGLERQLSWLRTLGTQRVDWN